MSEPPGEPPRSESVSGAAAPAADARADDARPEAEFGAAGATPDRPHPAQRRTLVVLSLAQALGGLSNGVALGVGSLLVEQVTGRAELAGLAATLLTLGGAALAVPLARLAQRRGRRIALTSGTLLALAGAVLLAIGGTLGSPAIVLPGFFVLGGAMAVNLQSRFAATDLSTPRRRGRDLSLVVWMTTIGVVIGPNLIGPGDTLGLALGLPHLVGAYVISAVAMAITAAVLWVLLRPDPLLESRVGLPTQTERPRLRLRAHPRALAAVIAVAAAHSTMVGVMALTPVHLDQAGQHLGVIGFTMSAHTAGMYALSPVFGWLTDRVGARATVLTGAGILLLAIAANLALPAGLAPIGLALLGLGWSAATVAGSTLVAAAVELPLRPALQGRSDLVMGLCAAAAGAAAGPILGVVGYAGLNLAMVPVIAVLAVTAVLATRGRATQPG
ncbi:MFS transporter [Agrococcus sp. KRD186]|jgi:MFS family permease|uniref:MFS transporter n=1 Tax=Agrococcus sp. KRD186 TaxID=2729730 RepID=UPI0019D05099|nr:MFS transporter [Agrococcus sp. KRD186]